MTSIEEIWSDEYLVKLERAIWVRVMEVHHRQAGLVSEQEIRDSEAVIEQVDLQSIHRREMRLKHDLMARLEEFTVLSGHQRIHLGMTSADIVENTYAIRIRRSVLTIFGYDPEPIVANALWFQPFRGVRGPVGSDVDQLNLLGSSQSVERLNSHLASAFGFQTIANAVPQCMPRSYDIAMASALVAALPHQDLDYEVRALLNGYLTMLSGQEYWLEGDVATSVIRRVAWPNLLVAIGQATEDV